MMSLYQQFISPIDPPDWQTIASAIYDRHQAIYQPNAEVDQQFTSTAPFDITNLPPPPFPPLMYPMPPPLPPVVPPVASDNVGTSPPAFSFGATATDAASSATPYWFTTNIPRFGQQTVIAESLLLRHQNNSQFGRQEQRRTSGRNGVVFEVYQERRKANQRERRRMKMINDAFLKLRDRVPRKLLSENRKTKVEILLAAIRYIRLLKDSLESDGDDFLTSQQNPFGHNDLMPLVIPSTRRRSFGGRHDATTGAVRVPAASRLNLAGRSVLVRSHFSDSSINNTWSALAAFRTVLMTPSSTPVHRVSWRHQTENLVVASSLTTPSDTNNMDQTGGDLMLAEYRLWAKTWTPDVWRPDDLRDNNKADK